MTQPFRTPNSGRIDRTRPLKFTFDGKLYSGFAGDTLASALLANGVRLVGRSFKYHRPRGFLSAGFEEPNALVELRSGARREPNTRATTIELYDGLEAVSQNRWPSLKFDALAINSLLSPIFAAGFYYKTFMWPASFWEKLYEPLIRRAAGLGRASGVPDVDSYDKITEHCDILVIGSGPAGLSAALTGARSGARVILAEEDFDFGGRLLTDSESIGDLPAAQWAAQTLAELQNFKNVTLLRRTSVFGVYDHGTYAAVERVNDHLASVPAFEPRQRLWRIIAEQAILAAGSIERPLIFGDNDRPNVMLAGAARAYVSRFGAKPGQSAVIFSNNDDSIATLETFTGAGIHVAAYVDARPELPPALIATAQKSGTKLISGVVTRAPGQLAVSGAEIRAHHGGTWSLKCDLLAMSGGWNPAVHLTSHLGGKPVWNADLAAFVPGSLPPNMIVAGAANGEFLLADCLASGKEAARRAIASLPILRGASKLAPQDEEIGATPLILRHSKDEASHALHPEEPRSGVSKDEGKSAAKQFPLWQVKNIRGKAFVDFQNDVSVKDIELAHREGYRSVEHLKRYTTLGMATDQGKTANVNGLALMAEISQKSIEATGTTRFRPPFSPVSLGVLAGIHTKKDFRPTRLTAGHDWAVEQGAVFMEAGLWLRAQYFPRGDEDWLAACNREVLAVRGSVGVCDVSTLGKIDIQGKDASAFLDRVYCNTFSTLAVGRVRYGLMLREDGFVMDDGTCARLGENHFFMTTTTVNAVKVMQHLEFCAQVLWPELDVQMISATEHWAQYSIAGPNAREVVAALVKEDISNAAFPYMAYGEVQIGSTKGRLYRISFSGELAYEIGVPAQYGDALIRAIMAAGAPYGILPYGIEALNVMRIEKGHLGGSELNGQTTAADLGLGKMMAMKKDFIGRALSQRPALIAQNRPVLVGVKPVNPGESFAAGAHILPVSAQNSAENDLGHISSAGFSPNLGHHIGLALVQNGTSLIGQQMRAYDPIRGKDTKMEICSPHFIDPEGSRLRV